MKPVTASAFAVKPIKFRSGAGPLTCLFVESDDDRRMDLMPRTGWPFFDTKDAALEFLKAEGANAQRVIETTLGDLTAGFTTVDQNSGDVLRSTINGGPTIQ
jgi:hypothetical protein